MHFDLLHALVAGVLILATIKVADITGLYVRDPGKRFQWSWPLFGLIFAVMFVFNLIWPYG